MNRTVTDRKERIPVSLSSFPSFLQLSDPYPSSQHTMVATSIPIRYTRLDPSLFSQHTLGAHSGTQIETDNILLEPLLVRPAALDPGLPS